jgi:hypothetical protein
MSTNATRSAAGYFKLATFCQRSITWRDGKKAFNTLADATSSAKKPGKYRASHVTSDGRTDLDPFDVL